MDAEISDHAKVHDVPFLSNRDDDKHCLQAAYGMIRQFFEPDWQIDWRDWSATTGFEEGRGSWSLEGMLWFHANNYDVQHVTAFDYQRFADEGIDYIYESLGKEVGDWEAHFFDIPKEQSRAKAFLATTMWQHRRPDFEDIKLYIERGYLVKCIVNLNHLNDLPGFVGHAVLAVGYTGEHIVIHDPGLPAVAYRSVPYEKFLRAWTDPNANMEKLDAIKLVSVSQGKVPQGR